MSLTQSAQVEKKIVEIMIKPAGGISLTVRERISDQDGNVITETFKKQELTQEQFEACANHLPDGVKTLYQEISDVCYSYIQ
jgi:hypothetical protein